MAWPTALSPVRGKRFTGLDGLRGIAVIAVIIYHLYPQALPGGFIGVDIFFVISGFLITSLLISERQRTSRIHLGRFWLRRIRRLLPALIVLLLICSTLAWLISKDILLQIKSQLLSAATFSYNWVDIFLGQNYFSPNTHELFRNLWSLAVEEQFYWLWPIAIMALMFFIRHTATRIAILLLLALVSATWMGLLYSPGTDPTRAYFGTDSHSFGLLIGAALAVYTTHPYQRAPGRLLRFLATWVLPFIGLMALGAVLYATWYLHDNRKQTYWGGLFAVSCLSALVISGAITRSSFLGKLLDVTPLRAIGVRSYGLYLWHWPLSVLIAVVMQRYGQRQPWWVGGVITIVLTIGIAWLSYRYIEEPIRRHGLRGIAMNMLPERWATSPALRRLVFAGLAALFVAAAAGTYGAITEAPKHTSAEEYVERGTKAVSSARPTSTATTRATPQPRTFHTAPAVPEVGPGLRTMPTGDQITAIGDSVMLASAPELVSTFPGIAVDAQVSRSMEIAPELLRNLALNGALRQVVLVGLGTNGPFDADLLDTLREIIGPYRQMVLINVQAPREWTAGVNSELANYTTQNPQFTRLADWQSAIAGHLDLLADDDIHPGPIGGQIYSNTVRAALASLVETPPVRTRNLEGPL